MAVETLAWTLLRRYGVVFRRVIAREAMNVPWRELTRVYKEAEDLRMQATLGQERIARLERELRALKAESQARPAEDKKAGRSAPKR